LAGGDTLLHLRAGLSIGALEEKEVAILVDVAATETEVPVDHPDRALYDQVIEPGLFRGLPQGSLGRRLATLEVALREAPILVGVADQEVLRGFSRSPAEHDAAGTDLQLRPAFAH
jgi:hypothetical protein